MIEWFLIRHSVTEGNKKKRYIGRTDEPLCSEGIDLLKKGTYPQTENVFVSPMTRCAQTAGIIYPKARLHIIDDFRECDFGEFENQNYLELAGNENYQKWIDSGGTLAFPGGESPEEFKHRTLRGFQRTAAYCLRNGRKKAALVVHGGTIMNIMEAWGPAGRDFYQWRPGNACGYHVVMDTYLWAKGERCLRVEGSLPIQ